MSDCSPLRLNEGDQQSSPSSQASGQNSRDNNDTHYEHDEMGELKYGAEHVISLFIPVSICMLIVVATIKATDAYHYTNEYVIWYAPFTDQSVDTVTKVWQSFANAFILLIFIIFMTCVLIMLYKFSCYKIIHGWLILSSLLLLFIFTVLYIAEFLRVYNIPMDDHTMTILIWNIGVVGMICIHWKGPLLLQQGYLIVASALMALIFIKYLPDWTVWTVLAVVSFWDLVAVLSPRGPLRMLVETAQERNEPLFPALIYSSAMAWMVGDSGAVASSTSSVIPMARLDKNRTQSAARGRPHAHDSANSAQDNQSGQARSSSNDISNYRTNATEISANREHPPAVAIIRGSQEGGARRMRHSRSAPQQILVGGDSHQDDDVVVQISQNHQEEEEERGVKLGLGDFIFFSLLVGKASSFGDWNITLACFVAILVGLCCTLALLAINRKALPALPISIAFGMSFFFLSYTVIGPLAETLAWEQVYV